VRATLFQPIKIPSAGPQHPSEGGLKNHGNEKANAEQKQVLPAAVPNASEP
jgi:hypothetical protein